MNKNDFIKEVENIYNENNNTITMKDILNKKGLNRDNVYKYFKSFHNMCEELNLYTPTPIPLSNEEIINILKDIYIRNGKVTSDILKKEKLISGDTLKRRFGSIGKAYEIAGIPLKQGQRKMVSKDEITDEIYRLIDLYGYISKPIMEKYSSYSPKVVQRIFGSFSNMYSELKLQRHPSGYIPSNKELIDDIKNMYKNHGLINSNVIDFYGKFSRYCYKTRWSSLKEVCEEAGVPYSLDNTTGWNGGSDSADLVIRKFEKYLKTLSIREKSFPWLKNNKTKQPFRVDAVFLDLKIALEYNGPQHYKVDGRYTKTEEDLKRRQSLDQKKYTLLKEHGFKVIVIHYKDKVTDDYIEKALK